MKMKVHFKGFNSKQLREARDRAIEKTARKSIKIVEQEITRRKLINTGNLLDSVGATIQRNGVLVEVNADYAGILNEGIKPHKMKYLKNKGPIPIITKSGTKIFRVATTKTEKNGKWKHPGFKRGKGFFDAATVKIQDSCEKIIASEIEGIT
jgi:Bacteriophage HK97-gp10, putative tail-component